MSLGRRLLRRFYFDLFLAPRGYGRPIEKAEWERQYESGAWRHLGSLEELGHYTAIVGYIRSGPREPSVLDVGCGHGRLLELLAPHFGTYTGIDVSSRAIKSARQLGIPNAEFIVGSFEDWTSTTLSDYIVFNESLSYAREPARLLSKYLDVLTPDGRVVISLCDYGNHKVIWRKVSQIVQFISSVHIRNDHGQQWDVRLGQRK